MVPNLSPAMNVIVAVLLSMAPQLIGHLDTKGSDAGAIRKMYAEAQKQAQHMIETGDTTQLASLSKELGGLDADLGPLQPLMAQLAAQPGVSQQNDAASDLPVNF